MQIKMKENINAIIFDLGGVILNIDFNITIQALAKLGMNQPNKVFGQYAQASFFDKFDKGEIDEKELFIEMRKFFNYDITDKDLKKAWNDMILNLPKYRIELLKKVRKNYKIFLLSNTNTLHHDFYTEQIKGLGEKSYESLFDGAYYSFMCGMRKPEHRIFMKVIQENNLNPANTLFIDDTSIHTNSASELGINTIHLKPNEDIINLFNEKGELY